MRKTYVCHSGGYDSTLMIYELCKKAKALNENIEIFPIYLKSSSRPHDQEIFHAKKSIKYFNELFRSNAYIHPLDIHELTEMSFDCTRDVPQDLPRYRKALLYYSNFLVNVSHMMTLKGVDDVCFGFHQGDGIFSYLKDFETALQSLRRLSVISIGENKIGSECISDDLYFLGFKDLNIHYPLKSVVKRNILDQYIMNPDLRNKRLCYACECRGEHFNILNDCYVAGHPLGTNDCNKCSEISELMINVLITDGCNKEFKPVEAREYFFNKIDIPETPVRVSRYRLLSGDVVDVDGAELGTCPMVPQEQGMMETIETIENVATELIKEETSNDKRIAFGCYDGE